MSRQRKNKLRKVLLNFTGKLKFDLTQYDNNFFDRLKGRVQILDEAGIYAGVYLFTAEFVFRFRFAGDGYPFSGPNNINGIDDGYRGGKAGTGLASFTMSSPDSITDIQDKYVKKVIDELNGFPNVLWIVSEEAPAKSVWWNQHMINAVSTKKIRKNGRFFFIEKF